MPSSHVHGAHCACAHHHQSKSALLSLLPALGCALCPACLALWKPLLSLFGVVALVDEQQHAWLLFGALTIALGFGLREALRLREWLPFWPALAGALLIIAGHVADSHVIEWAGTLVMFLSMPVRLYLRRREVPA